MKLSKQTLEVLKNFATINANLMVKPGNKLSTVAIQRNIVGTVEVPETFPEEFGIFNLPEFLGVVGLMSDPEIIFDSTHMTLKEGKSKMKYMYADASILVFPSKDIKLPSEDVTITMTNAHLTQIAKAAAAIGVQDLALVGDGESVVVKVLDKKVNSNAYTIDLDTKSSEVFTLYFKVDNLKMIPDTYEMTCSKQNISRFVGKELKVTYFVAIELDSTWG